MCVWVREHSDIQKLSRLRLSPLLSLSLSPTSPLRFSGSVATATWECAHKRKGWVPVWVRVTLVHAVDTHANFQLVVSSSDFSASNNPPPTPSCFLLSCFALSLRVCVPAGSDSSSSHLVLGKLGYANNISAQNISTTSSSSGGEKQWPSYSTAAPAYLHNPWPCCYPPVGVCDGKRKRERDTQTWSEWERDWLCENEAVYRLELACVVFGIGNSLVLFWRKQHCAELVHIQRRATLAQQLIVNGHAVATGKCLLSRGELVPTLPNTPIVLSSPPPAPGPCPQHTVHWTCRGILFTH